MKYRLPEELCGADYEGFERRDSMICVRVPGIGVVHVPAHAVIEVKDPLPEEPPVGTVVLVDGEALQNLGCSYDETPPWAGVGAADRYTWAQVCALANGTPVRLVRVPEPVGLPWVEADLSVFGPKGSDHRPRVTVGIEDAESFPMEPGRAVQMAHALLTAAGMAMAQS